MQTEHKENYQKKKKKNVLRGKVEHEKRGVGVIIGNGIELRCLGPV